MGVVDTVATYSTCRYCGSRTKMVWRVLRGEGGKVTDRRVTEVRCSNDRVQTPSAVSLVRNFGTRALPKTTTALAKT